MNNSITPKDYYVVYNDYFDYSFEKELYILYLPLLGSNTIKLYQYLSTKLVGAENNTSNRNLHFDIFDNLSLDIKHFVTSRKKLEALGLLETYVASSDNNKLFVYKILKPLNFTEFLNNMLLSNLLENTIGSEQYNIIKNKFSNNRISLSGFKNITAKFSEVYTLENIDDYTLENIDNTAKGPNLDEYYFDFNKLKFLLTDSFISDLIDNQKIRQDILSLAHLYKVTPADMASGIKQSISSNGSELDIELLKGYLIQLFTIVKKQDVATLNTMLNKKIIEETYENKPNLSTEERYAKSVDSLNYVDFLNRRYSIVVSEIDGKNIQKLQEKYNFTSGVLNVLLDYSIKESKSNKIPHFNYLDKIASTWSSYRLVSALDAINFVISEKEKYEKNKDKSSKKNTTKTNVKSSTNSSNNKHVVKAPDYIKEQLETFNDSDKERITSEEDVAELTKFKEFLAKKGID